MVIETAGGKHILPFADAFRILRHLFSRDRRKQISLEQRMRSANKAWWRDANFYRCNNVPWKIMGQRVFDRVYSVFCFGCEMLRAREMKLEQGNDGQDQRMENEAFTKSGSGCIRRTKRYRVTAPGQPEWRETFGNSNEIPLFDRLHRRGNLEDHGVVQQRQEECSKHWNRYSDGDYLVEDLPGAEHEAGFWELHELEAHAGWHNRDASGTKLRPLGLETKNGCHNEKKGALKKTRRTL